jgi:hypothetical protein
MMREFLYRLVRRLHEEARPLSRNKHFHAFTGEAGRALRIDRHLRDLQQHLELLRARGQRPRVRSLKGGAVQLVLPHPTLTVVRTATLSREEVELLAATPAGAWALGAGELADPAAKPAAKQG